MHIPVRINRAGLLVLSLIAAGQLFFATGQPSILTISGELTDIEDHLVGVANPETLNVVVNIYDRQTGGNAQYTESFNSTNRQSIIVDKGFFNIALGSGTTTDTLKTVLQRSNNLWAEVTIDNDILSRAPITGSPYILLNSSTLLSKQKNNTTEPKL